MWVLVLALMIGPLSERDSNALATVTGFRTLEGCKQAGAAVQKLGTGTKRVDVVCVEVK